MLRKVGGRKLVEYESHLYIVLVLNDMWVEWVSGMWCLFIIHNNYESGVLFADGPKWKKWDSYSRTERVCYKTLKWKK